MRGLNVTVASGQVVGELQSDPSKPACSFVLVLSQGPGGPRDTLVRVNVYQRDLYELCTVKVRRGQYLLVRGELMNRPGEHGRLVDVRAHELVFMRGEE